jgi:hypothetical protein
LKYLQSSLCVAAASSSYWHPSSKIAGVERRTVKRTVKEIQARQEWEAEQSSAEWYGRCRPLGFLGLAVSF